MPKKDEEKYVRLVLPEPVHDRLRMAAAQAKVSMAAFCAAAVEKAVNEAIPPKTGRGSK